jgi:hypothetical protein
MKKYQVYIAVDVTAADDDEAWATGEALCDLLGESWRTTSIGTVTEVLVLEDEPAAVDDDFPEDDNDDGLGVADYDPMSDFNYVGHPAHY